MRAIFYKFTKRPASTATPTGNGYAHDIQLKSPTLTTQPIITLKGVKHDYTYAYIEEFSRYYFVSRVTVIGITVEYELFVDVLGTYKTAITEHENRYSRTPFSNDYVPESAFTLSHDLITSAKTETLYPLSSCYLVDITTPNGGGANPTTQTLICSINDLKALISKLYDSTTYGGDTLDIVTQTVADPLQYIRGVRYCPFLNDTDKVVVQSPIKIGWVDINFGRPFYALSPNVKVAHFSVDMEAFTLTREAVNSDMTSYTLYLAGHGAINIPNEVAVKGFNIDITVSYDTGDTYTVLSVDNQPFKVLTGHMMTTIGLTGVSTQLTGNVLPNLPKMIAGGIRDKMNLVTTATTFLGGLFDGIKQGAQSVKNNFVESYKTKSAFETGTSGSVAELTATNKAILVKEAHTYVSVPHTLIGYSNDYVGVPTASGYYKAITANINPTCTAQERDELARLMQEGFYFE